MEHYQPTQKELNDFYRDKKGYSKPLIPIKKEKPTHGQLVWTECGKDTILHHNKPFALLQSLKSGMIKNGYDKKKLFIKNL